MMKLLQALLSTIPADPIRCKKMEQINAAEMIAHESKDNVLFFKEQICWMAHRCWISSHTIRGSTFSQPKKQVGTNTGNIRDPVLILCL
jgi:hypothetical protein